MRCLVVTRDANVRHRVYDRLPGLKPDDYTQLASIHVVDSCARHGLLDEAVEVRAC